MQQNITSMITQLQPLQQSSTTNDQVDNLAKLKNQILFKMEHIDTLNLTYKQKNQIEFLKTFQKIMNQLSQQLKNAVQAYQNIDHQIQQDPKCILLTKQAQFYKQQRQIMDEKYQQELLKLNQAKMRNNELKKRKNELKRKSIISQQKIIKYENKNKSLSFKFNQFITNDDTIDLLPSNKKMTQSTKYNTSGDKTRILSFNNQNRKTIFENTQQSEIQNKRQKQNKIQKKQRLEKDKRRNYSFSRNKVNKMLRSQNTSPYHNINNFLI